MEKKQQIFEEAGKLLENNNLTIETCDDNRPWGGFFVIHENSAEAFIDTFFADLDKSSVIKGKISPKILLEIGRAHV